MRTLGSAIYGVFFVGGGILCFLLFLLWAFLYATWPYGFILLAMAAGATFGLRELRKWAAK